MCLAIPGKIVQILNPDDALRQAIVDFGGIQREICIAWIDANVGGYILVHAGMASSVIDEEEARLTVHALNKAAQLDLNLLEQNHQNEKRQAISKR